MKYVVVIHPREGVSAEEIAKYLVDRYQVPAQDGGPIANAKITVVPADVDPEELLTEGEWWERLGERVGEQIGERQEYPF